MGCCFQFVHFYTVLYKNVDKRSYNIKLKNNRPDVLVMKF